MVDIFKKFQRQGMFDFGNEDIGNFAMQDHMQNNVEKQPDIMTLVYEKNFVLYTVLVPFTDEVIHTYLSMSFLGLINIKSINKGNFIDYDYNLFS
jgi:hypothetical protein